MAIKISNEYPRLKPVEIYHEQRAAHGRLEESAYKALPAYATVIGGLWFFATTTLETHPIVGFGVFIFSALSAVAFALASRRFQHVGYYYTVHFRYWEKELNFEPPEVRLPRTLTTIGLLLSLSVILSILGAAYAGGLAFEVSSPLSHQTKADQSQIEQNPSSMLPATKQRPPQVPRAVPATVPENLAHAPSSVSPSNP